MTRTEIDRKFDETCAEPGRSTVAFAEIARDFARRLFPLDRYAMIMDEVSTRRFDRAMARLLSVAEAAAVYGTAVADLQRPIILQQEGQPFAVIIAFEEYQRLRALAIDEAQRRQAGWQALEALLQDVHRRPSDLSPEQIEAEIGLARAEAKQARHDRSG